MSRSVTSMIYLGISISLAMTGASVAQTLSESGESGATPGSVDCTEVSVDYQDDPTLTRAERIELMDRALSRSLSKFDACQTAQSGSASEGGNGGGGGGSNGGTSASGGQGSVASQDMAGTEESPATESSGNAVQSAANPPAGGNDPSSPTGPDGSKRETAQSPDNGKIPEDIPPADNDSVLEAQIRRAATNETDPEIKKNLWNEYRKYKGLPSVN